MLKFLLRALGVVAALYFGAAVGLALWPASPFKGSTLTAEKLRAGEIAAGTVFDQVYPFAERTFEARDGTKIYGRIFPGTSSTTVLLLHGVASDSTPLNAPAGLLAQASGARVVTVDLRGHGKSEGPRWRVSHIGQYEEDVADIVAALRQDFPDGKVVLAGHSMGGGIALRYALLSGKPRVDGYLLYSPLLGGDAPTMPKGERDGAGDYMHFQEPRFFGVLMLNMAGITIFNDLPILYFNQPPETPAYGFAAVASMQPNPPKDYRAALRAVSVPLLLVAGTKDEAFNAAAYPGVVSQNGSGRAVLVEGATHNGILTDAGAAKIAGEFIKGL